MSGARHGEEEKREEKRKGGVVRLANEAQAEILNGERVGARGK